MCTISLESDMISLETIKMFKVCFHGECFFISNNSDSDEERELKKVHLNFDLEAAELLPLVVK